MRSLALILSLAACGAETTAVTVELAPDIVSSIDGSLSVRVTALADREPAPGEAIELAFEYTDRNGNPHAISPISGTTDEAGAFDTVVEGFTFDGVGLVTATVTGTTIASGATFAVLDRTPPTVEIMPPATSSVRIGNDVQIMIHVTDEIGVSQVFFETTEGTRRDRGEIVASGATDTMVSFEFQVGDNAVVGSTITLFALAADLSGNQAAAQPVTLTVVP